MNVPIDENLPVSAARLAELGVTAEHVTHVGMGAMSDAQLWAHAFERDQLVLAINASDFLRLAAAVELHPGLIVLRSQGLTREEQWEWIAPVIEWVLTSGAELVNHVVEVRGPGKFTVRALPV